MLLWCLIETYSFFVCLVALRPKSTAMVIAGRSVHLATLSYILVLKKGVILTKFRFYIKRSMVISGKGFTQFLLTSIVLDG